MTIDSINPDEPITVYEKETKQQKKRKFHHQPERWKFKVIRGMKCLVEVIKCEIQDTICGRLTSNNTSSSFRVM